MSQSSVPVAPPLSASFCFSTTVLRDFLRSARVLDDTISAQMNSLAYPLPFDRSRPSRASTKSLTDAACRKFIYQTVKPTWEARDMVLDYCQRLAEKMDQDTILVETEPDHRRDPYSGRQETIEGKRDQLLRTVRYERSIEEIIRDRSWSLIVERCDRSDLPTRRPF